MNRTGPRPRERGTFSINDEAAFLVAHNIAKRVSEELTFPGEIRVTVLRETRAIEYAR